MNDMSDETLTIILGAGASYDCADSTRMVPDDQYRPPLVKDLFDQRVRFNNVLSNYPRAESLAPSIRSRLARGLSIEDILRQADSESELVLRRASWQIPPYLQHLLGEISEKYIQRGGTNFDTLIHAAVRSSFKRILLLTLNYDLFIERTLTSLFGVPFTDFRSYLSLDRFALVKLHGSVLWANPLRNDVPSTLGSLREALDYIEGNVEVDRTKFRFLGSYLATASRQDGFLFYPALAVPVTGKTEFVCPPDHLQYFRRFLPTCRHFLLIGFSALDAHVRTELKAVREVRKLTIVNGNKLFGLDALNKLVSDNDGFGALGPDQPLYDGGFNHFAVSGALDRFFET
jgi:hypothetical protein